MKKTIVGWFLALVLGSAGAQPVPTDVWKPHSKKVGWWTHEQPRVMLEIGMKNHGLYFHGSFVCPPGSTNEKADVFWYGGDEVSRFAINCNGDLTEEDVRFHLKPEFFMKLPVLPRKQLFEAIYPHPNRP